MPDYGTKIMQDATVTINGGNVVISTVHHGTSEGWMIVAPPALPVEVREHYYDDAQRKVVVETNSYPTLLEALRAIAEAES